MEFINSELHCDDLSDVSSSTDSDVEEKSDPNRATILRSKGFFWLASRYDESLVWSQAGGLFRMSTGGPWWVDTPRELWPEEQSTVADILHDFAGDVGDRRCEFANQASLQHR
jgi:G3E family GTPase